MTLARPLYYVLHGRTAVPATVEQWAVFFGDIDNRRVAEDIVGTRVISTVFLGLDHNYGSSGAPLIFETMIFEGADNTGYCTRCSTWEEAEVMHAVAKTAVERLKVN